MSVYSPIIIEKAKISRIFSSLQISPITLVQVRVEPAWNSAIRVVGKQNVRHNKDHDMIKILIS